MRSLVLLASILVAATPARADVGQPRAGRLAGPRDVVRVGRATLELAGTPNVVDGVNVGVAAFDEVHGTLELKNPLDRAVKDVVVEVTFFKDAGALLGGGGKRAASAPGKGGKADDRDEDDEAGEAGDVAAYPIPGWKFRYTAASVPAGGTASVACKSPLPDVTGPDRPLTWSDVTFTAEVVGYRAPGLGLARAVELARQGGRGDLAAVFHGYGDGLDEPARARDEALLLDLLGVPEAPPDPEAGAPPPKLAPSKSSAKPATFSPVELAFLLVAARRIGTRPTLEGLLLDEARLAHAVPPPPPDAPAPSPEATAIDPELVPSDFEAAVHETLVAVAHRNLGALYAILHGPRAALPVGLAAARFANDEQLDSPDAWLEAAEGAAQRPLVEALARYGGPEVMPTLYSALDGDDPPLRRAAAIALATRGDEGIGHLVGALDTEDEERHQAAAAALAHLTGDGAVALARAARTRGVPLPGEAPIPGVEPPPPIAMEVLAAIDAFFYAKRARAVDELLAKAKQAAAASIDKELPASAALGANPSGADAALGLLAKAQKLSPRAYREARERVARVAVLVYRARRKAGRADARTPLEQARALGPIQDPAFRAAWRETRIEQARALAARDLEQAIALLCNGAAVPADEGERAAAVQLLLGQLDERIARRDARGALATLARARRFGATAADLRPRERRLWLLRLERPAIATASALVGLLLLALMLRFRRRRAAPRPIADEVTDRLS